MATITFKGSPVSTVGTLPAVGARSPDFLLTNGDLSDVKLSDYAGKNVVLNIFPSIDTGVCAASVRKFNEKAGKKGAAVVLCISADLPFALGRFCGAEGLSHVVPLSVFRSPDFGKAYGVTMSSGPLRGLLSRAVLVIDASGKIVYTEQVPEIGQEPDYAAALKALA